MFESKRIGVLTGMLLAALPAGLFLYFVNPAESKFLPPCPFYFMTGLYCPGCGSTRGLHHLLHGDMAGALDLNPLMVLFVPVFFYAFVALAVRSLTGRELPRLFPTRRSKWILFLGILLYWVARNIPFAPFSYLAP